MKELSHTDKAGRASMVDVSAKPGQLRTARASGFIRLEEETLKLVRENSIKKGAVLTVAEIAGIQAAKQTSALIPLCHPLALSKVEVECIPEEKGIRVHTLVKCTGPTGVEMEALTAAGVALLTIYDMCKAVDKNMVLSDIHLVSKEKTNPDEHEEI
ncbi:MAG: cyclic pyranopterin monophosphate synthase MoaC [Bacteroidota bacterium]